MQSHRNLTLAALLAFVSGCSNPTSVPTPQFEVRDFVVTEEKSEATQYSKEWNSFKGAGTIVARNVEKDRNLIVVLEIRDETKGPSAEPDIGSFLVRGGVGKVAIQKSKYGELSAPPKYSWKVIGWYELRPATIEAPGQPAK